MDTDSVKSEFVQIENQYMDYKFACYTPDHDVLTDDGGNLFEITMRDKVASLQNGKELKYV